MTSSAIDDLTGQLAQLLPSRGLMLCTAESCTGGLIAAACTERAGSSVWFERGFVSYSNASKTDLLGVPADLIARHGAVSQEVARAMAAGALTHAQAELAVAVTGVAGPGGGSAQKPVGTVWLAWAMGSQVRTECRHFEGDRSAVRQATVARALQGLVEMLQMDPAS
jgi:nicotinamide-nucleotide amidase